MLARFHGIMGELLAETRRAPPSPQQHRRAPPGYPGPPHGCACARSDGRHTSGLFMKAVLHVLADTAKPCIGALAQGSVSWQSL